MIKNKKIIIIVFAIIFILSSSVFAFIKITNKKEEKEVEIKITEEIKSFSLNNDLFPFIDEDIPIKIPKVLRKGDVHPLIKDIQQILMNNDYMENDEPIEEFLEPMEIAIKAFQKLNSLPADGEIGNKTLAKLFGTDIKKYVVKKDDVGEDVKVIQTKLMNLGYLPPDFRKKSEYGKFKEFTHEAVLSFQRKNSIMDDGQVGHQTLETLHSDDVKNNIISDGEKSDLVKIVQEKLQEKGYLTSIPDGSYGKSTKEAIKRVQAKHDLDVDGALGPDTMEVIYNSLGPNSYHLGDSGRLVEEIQSELKRGGYLKGSIDGYYGEDTEKAIKEFQKENKFKLIDGKAGKKTLTLLSSKDYKKAKKAIIKTKNNRNNRHTDEGSLGNISNSKNINIASNSEGVRRLINTAMTKLGTPYRWGAKGKGAFDCSGFVYWCLNNSGVSQPYLTSSAWSKSNKYRRINNFSDIIAGDIVVVKGHVGIALGNGEVIDASSSNGRVVRRSLSSWWRKNFRVAFRIF